MSFRSITMGMLRHRVNVMREVDTPDGQGGRAVVWSSIGTRWAKVEPLAGRELYAAQQVNQSTSHKITLRYFAGLTAADRIQFGARQFNIREVVNVDEINQWHELVAEEFSE